MLLGLSLPAGQAAASTFTTAMDTSPPIVHVNDGLAVNQDVYMGPMEFTSADTLTTLLVWCIDLQHTINIGQSYEYTTQSLTSYLGSSFDAAVWTEVAGLVKAGSLLSHGPAMNPYQGAIWDTLHPGVVSSGDAVLMSSVHGLEGQNLTSTFAGFTVYTPVNGGQTMVGWNPVPEPATWGLMILGLGGVGAMLRRRRRTSAAFA